MQITSILTPLVRKEIPVLLKWIRYCPAPCPQDRRNTIKWYLSIDKSWTDSDIELITRHVENSGYSCIDLKFISIGLTDEESVYLRSLSRKDSCNLEYGSKSGPNLQFFKSIQAVIKNNPPDSNDAVILMETDAIPLRPNWIDSLNLSLDSLPSFWIAGARYAGKSPLSDAIRDHYNGNAVYGIGDSGFNDFLERWQKILRMCTGIRHWVAYDFALSWIQYHLPQIKHRLSSHDIRLVETTATKASTMLHDLSHLIHNVSGDYEVRNKTFDVSELPASAIVCHSKPLALTIGWSLSKKGLNTLALSRECHLNRRIDALGAGIHSYLNYGDYNSFSVDIVSRVLDCRSHLRSGDAQYLFQACLSSPSQEQVIQ